MLARLCTNVYVCAFARALCVSDPSISNLRCVILVKKVRANCIIMITGVTRVKNLRNF